MISLRYRAALFDLDGTLIDSGTDLVASLLYALARVFPGRDLPDREDVLVQVGKPLEVIVRELGYPPGEDDARRFAEVYRAHYAKHFNEHTKPYAGVEGLLGQLKAAGVRLALVTTKHQAQADFTLRAFGLARFFDYVHGWQEGHEHKPHPEPVLTALNRLGVRSGEAIMVGDSELDIESAEAAGVATCAVTYGFRPAWFLRSFRPDFLVSRAADISPIVISTTQS